MQPDAKYNIICLSNQLWDYPNWTNKRHVMHRLASSGHKVLFVDPPVNFGRVLLRQFLRGLFTLTRLLKGYKIDESSARIYTPVNLLPFHNITSASHLKKIASLSRDFFDPSSKTVLWIYHVQLKGLQRYIETIKYDVLVYDCVDNYDAFPEETSPFRTSVYGQELKVQETALAQRANVVFASAPGLVDKLKKHSNHVYFTPNVGDYPRFKDTKKYKDQIPQDLASIPRPRIGTIGAVDSYKFDAELYKYIAQQNPSFSFVLIGPMGLKDKNATLDSIGLGGLSNVYYLGSRPYEQKYLYMAGFDVDIIPYVISDYTVGGCFPVKFHDSLAAGLPVVVTDLPAYSPFRDVCYISKSYTEFSQNIKKALQEDNDDKIKQRQEVARQNDWDGKVQKMLQLIHDSLVK
ncbi:glycosyltransferase [Patescibacteria group bacterium]|nr:glycosyltransferase [Patescibacteria group bacterium]